MSNLKLIQLGSKINEKETKEKSIKVMKIAKPIGIIVRIDGTAEEIIIDKKLDIDNIDWGGFKGSFKVKGKGGIERECDWEMPDGLVVSMFGWVKGKEENINKLEVPPPVDMEIYYGDLLFIGTVNGIPIQLNIEKFEEFYSEAFGGFEDIEDSDNETNDEYEDDCEGDDCEGDDCEGDDDSFIVEDHESEVDASESESEAGDSETESESETEESDTESEMDELEYRSLGEEERDSEEVKKLEEEIEKITEEQIIDNCLGELLVGYSNEELCILSRVDEEERYGEEIEINGNRIVLIPME